MRIPPSLQRVAAILLVLLLIPFASIPVASATNDDAVLPHSWRADHHMHLSSPDLCRLIVNEPDGGCIESNRPPAVLAADAVKALEAAHVSKGVVLSGAYLYGLPSLHLSASEIAKKTRAENEFTATEVAKFPARLIALMSVDPLQDSAIEEIDYWAAKSTFVGVKLHFIASAVNIRSASDRAKVSRVVAEAAKKHLPLVIHVGGGSFDAADAEVFITEILPSGGDSIVQIAHAGGGLPNLNGNNLRVLRAFADHIVKNDPRTKHVLFDLSFVPGPDDSPADAKAYTEQIRRIGIQRFLFGSDFNVQMPTDAIRDLKKLELTPTEMQTLSQNCAPWAC
jgi:predicted TIM-barrel fold metal-dependent hydrolase